MSRALGYLLASQNPDGGWGYRSNGMSFVEPTAAAILALDSDAQARAQVQRAQAHLEGLQHSDGGWGIAAPDDESGWMTAWAVWALSESNKDAAERGAEWLLQTAGVRVTDPKQIEAVKRELRIDPTVTGWPWQPGDAAWIFPTSLALLALHQTDRRDESRVREGILFLQDRAIEAGGWNIGNPFMVTGSLPPTVEGTSLALQALNAYGIENEIMARGNAWLGREEFTGSAFEWAWRAWYWKGKGAPVVSAINALAKLQRRDGSFDGNPFTTAIALMGGAE